MKLQGNKKRMLWLWPLFFTTLFVHGQTSVDEEIKKGWKIGYIPTEYGKRKDRTDGVFAKYDYVWKQTADRYIVKKKIILPDGDETQEAFLVNGKGEILTKQHFTDIADFSEGLAEFTTLPHDFTRGSYDSGRYSFVVHLNNNCGFMDINGKVCIPPKYFSVRGGFSQGLNLVSFSTSDYFYINKKGEQQFGRTYKEAEPFRGKIAGITYSNGVKNFINLQGENLVPSVYAYIQPFSEDYRGMIRAYQPKNGKVGFWTSHCEDLLEPQFDAFNYGFLRNRILVKKDGKYGFLDFYRGNIEIPIAYSQVQKDKNLLYTLLQKEGRWFRSDTSHTLTPIIVSDSIQSVGHGLYKFVKNTTWGLVDSTGKVTCEPTLTAISDDFRGDFLPCQLDSKYGYINAKGELIISPIYDIIRPFEKALVKCDRGIWQESLNGRGEVVKKTIQPKLFGLGIFTVLILAGIWIVRYVMRK